MTLHVCRDMLSTGNPLSLSTNYISAYFTAIFCQAVLNYTVVGQTNFNLLGGTYQLGNGVAGSMNQGVNDPYAFAVNGYSVSAADIGRILAVKSPNNPLVNSGLLRITGINTVNNWVYVNYRSGDTPPIETGVQWAIFENEAIFVNNVNTTGNGVVNTYQGQGSATQSRIILQSPHITAWQVRICCENSYDLSGPISSNFQVTWAPGFGGNAAGDFAPGGQHLHGALFWNVHNSNYLGTTIALFQYSTNQSRYYMWGDDSTGSVFIAARNVVGNSDSQLSFGLCEDEEQPLPPHNAQRLFVIGANQGSNNGIYWACNSSSAHCGMAFGLSNQPISAIFSLYNPLSNQTFTSQPMRNAPAAGDNQYTSSSELLPIDILAGTYDNTIFNGDTGSQQNEILVTEGRRLGRAPFIRMGRSNYGYFQISTDPTHAWLHANDGVYLPWQGSILP